VIIGDAWGPNTVEPALEDGRKTKPPRREDKYKCFGGKKAVDLQLNGSGIECGSVVTLAFVGRERGREPRLVKVFCLNFVTRFDEGVDRGVRQGMTQAVRDWMSDYNKALHGRVR
jgi:hypothetical protein